MAFAGLQEGCLYSCALKGILSSNRKRSILLNEANSSSIKGIVFAALKDSVSFRPLMKESSIKAVEGEITWPVRERVITDMKVAAVPEINDRHSMIVNSALFCRIIQTSSLSGNAKKKVWYFPVLASGSVMDITGLSWIAC